MRAEHSLTSEQEQEAVRIEDILVTTIVVIGLCDGGNGLAECLAEQVLPSRSN